MHSKQVSITSITSQLTQKAKLIEELEKQLEHNKQTQARK